MLLDRYGKAITSEYSVIDQLGTHRPADLSKQVRAFFDSLNWLAFRTIFYTLSANHLGVDLFLHPIRQAFQVNFLSKLNQEDSSKFKPIIDAMNDPAKVSINTILEKTNPFVTKQPIPLFVTWFAEKVDDPQNYIDYAFQLRQERPFLQARQRLIDLEGTLESGSFITKANSLIMEVEESFESIVSKYSANTSQGVSLSNLITVWNLTTMLSRLPKIPHLDLRLKQLEFMKHLIPQKGFKSVYRSIIEDLSQVGRLGKYHEIISSRIMLEENADIYLDKTENARYKDSTSGWKIPM